MHGIELLHDLALVMIVAGVTTILFHRLKQPVALGYIVAGFIIGPYTPWFTLVRNADTVRALGDMGVVLLMLSLGLEFSLSKLTRVGMSAFFAAVLEITLMIWFGYEIGRAFGWSTMDSVFLGALMSISSTTIIVKALAELGKAHEGFAETIFGVLVIEDILAIILLALLSGFAQTGAVHPVSAVVEVIKIAVFFAMVLVVGLLGVPRLFNYISRVKSDEMLLVAALGLCFGVALLASMQGYSVALGAFLIGAVMAETRQVHKIVALTAPVRDMFSAIFFVTIGMLIEPRMLLIYAWPIAIISLVVVVGKVVTCSFGVFIGGKGLRTSLSVGMGLAQIGEFSFIIATLCLTLHVTSNFLYPIAVAVSVVTTLVTPYLIKATDPVVVYLERTIPPPILQAFEVYTTWIGSLSKGQPGPMVIVVRHMAWQLLINLLLTVGVFALGAWVVQWDARYLPPVLQAPDINQAIVWLGVMLITSSIYLASFRKLTAISTLVAEICFPLTAGSERGAAVRTVVSQVFVLAALVVMTFITILLSTSILSSFTSMILLLIIVIIATMLFRSTLVRIYSRAQIALNETLLELPSLRPEDAKPMPDLLEHAELEMIEIPSGAAVIARKLRDIPLRAQTGASIVAIERGGHRMINPGPEEMLHRGDHILLLGEPGQLPGARDLLTERPGPS
jgi:CPA2 family monovalent cation:H+ antiporter-2